LEGFSSAVGWSRAKKEAMINGEWNRLPELAKRRSTNSSTNRETA
jgi:hypothetical protein